MAQRGGKRPGAGRPKGAQNKATAQARATISEMAREYAADALETLREVARSGQSEAARVSAASAILDRAFGKPPQAITGGDGGPLHVIISPSDAEL